jgi:TRAP-type C4-dicarboxylate transport system substrate-binding protein
VTRKLFLILLALVLAVSIGLVACTTPAEEEEEEEEEEVIELTLALIEPEVTEYSMAVKEWIAKIENDCGGLVKITPYWSGTLIGPGKGKEECMAGVADITHIMVGYEPGFTLSNAKEAFSYNVPFEYQFQIFKEAFENIPEWKAEYDGVKIIGWRCAPNYWVHTCQIAIRTLEDFQGLTLKGLPFMAEPFKTLGAEITVVPLSELYTSLEKNIIDGWFLTCGPLKSFNLAEVTKYNTDVNLSIGASAHLVMNLDSWNSLPSEIQKVFEDNMEFHDAAVKRTHVELEQEAMGYALEMGNEFIELSPEDQQRLYDLMEESAYELAAQLDAQGLAGTELLEEIQRLVDEYTD